MPPNTNTNSVSMGSYGYQPLPPFAMTQPAAFPDWRTAVQPAQASMMPAAPAVASPAMSYDSFGSPVLAGSAAAMNADPTGLAQAQVDLSAAGNAPGGGWNWFSTRDQQGVLGPALQGAQTLAGLYMGMKQYGLAKDQLNFQKDSFNKQYAANQTLTNSRLEDRQRARVSSNAGAYQSVGDYMNQNGVK